MYPIDLLKVCILMKRCAGRADWLTISSADKNASRQCNTSSDLHRHRKCDSNNITCRRLPLTLERSVECRHRRRACTCSLFRDV